MQLDATKPCLQKSMSLETVLKYTQRHRCIENAVKEGKMENKGYWKTYRKTEWNIDNHRFLLAYKKTNKNSAQNSQA